MNNKQYHNGPHGTKIICPIPVPGSIPPEDDVCVSREGLVAELPAGDMMSH